MASIPNIYIYLILSTSSFAEKARGYIFGDFEAALARLGKDCCRKLRVTSCPMREICPKLRSARSLQIFPGIHSLPRARPGGIMEPYASRVDGVSG